MRSRTREVNVKALAWETWRSGNLNKRDQKRTYGWKRKTQQITDSSNRLPSQTIKNQKSYVEKK